MPTEKFLAKLEARGGISYALSFRETFTGAPSCPLNNPVPKTSSGRPWNLNPLPIASPSYARYAERTSSYGLASIDFSWHRQCPTAFSIRPEVASTLELKPLTEGPGSRVGSYKLIEQIGEGGMGVVYMAEQKEPVRRTVAIKIIKPGMDTKEVVARFEAERQALALNEPPKRGQSL